MGLARAFVRLSFAVALLICPPDFCGQTLDAQTRTSSSETRLSDTHALGVPVTTIIEFGDQYLGGDELYDVKITVLQIERGEKSWELVKEASASNPPAKPGYEYLLARVRFEFAARTKPSHYEYTINPSQFVATANDRQEYESPSLAEQPEPGMSGTLKPGDSIDGWVAFLLPRKDGRPLMIFREDVGSVIHRGGGTWFQLYRRAGADGATKTP
jgi:Domain of unknown function (DUF4352)